MGGVILAQAISIVFQAFNTAVLIGIFYVAVKLVRKYL